MSKRFRVDGIDHVELFVPDRYVAAKWYEQVFGIKIVSDYEDWAVEGGPLMVSSDGGRTKLALFEGEPPGFRRLTGFKRVAFRVDGAGFIEFLSRLGSRLVFTDDGQAVDRLQHIDHDKAYSVYFSDPYGNRYEVTTYDYEYVTNKLSEKQY